MLFVVASLVALGIASLLAVTVASLHSAFLRHNNVSEMKDEI